MHPRFFILSIIFLLFLSCNNDSATHEKIITKDSVKLVKQEILSTKENGFLTAKKYLDSLFNIKKYNIFFSEQTSFVDNNGQTINTALLIGNLFDPKIKNAIMVFRSNDSILNCTIYRDNTNQWTKIFETNITSTNVQSDDIIEIKDLNGDKIPDLKILKDFSPTAIRTILIADAWLYDGTAFTKIDGFDSLPNVECDSVNNKIYSYVSLGCADISKYFGEYKIIQKKAVLQKEISCDCCYTNDSCEITINNQKPFIVKKSNAYKFAPGFYKAMYKQELDE